MDATELTSVDGLKFRVGIYTHIYKSTGCFTKIKLLSSVSGKILPQKFMIHTLYFALQNLVFIIVGMGIAFSIVFHCVVREPVQQDDMSTTEIINGYSTSIEKSTVLRSKMMWSCWLKTMQFYQVFKPLFISCTEHVMYL